MTYATFNAVCPFVIGDKIKTYAATIKQSDVIINIMGIKLGLEVHEITDILCIHSLKSGKVTFQYELDNSKRYVTIVAE